MKWKFISQWLRHPLQTGAVTPSGKRLAQVMVDQVDSSCQTVLEVGPGTGVITDALLARGFDQSNLILVEKNEDLAEFLAHQFPELRVLMGDAGHMSELLGEVGVTQVDCIISSLPLKSMIGSSRESIMKALFAVLKPEGQLVQYTYSLAAPVSDEICRKLKIKGTRVARVTMNVPPATVWSYRAAD